MSSFKDFANNIMANIAKDNDVEQVEAVELEETSAVHEMKTSEGMDNPEHVDLLLVNDEDFKNIVKKEVGCPPSKANESSEGDSDEKSSIANKFICSKCNSDFSTKSEFREHYRQVHLNEEAEAVNKGNDERKSIGKRKRCSRQEEPDNKNRAKKRKKVDVDSKKHVLDDFFGKSSCMKGLPKTTKISFLNPSNYDPLEIKKEYIEAAIVKNSEKSGPKKKSSNSVNRKTEKTDSSVTESKQIESNSCNVCNKNFTGKKGMHKHNREIHGIRLRNPRKKNTFVKVKTEKTDNQILESKQNESNSCHICNKNFKDKKKMNKHNRQSHGIRIRNPYKTKSKDSDNNTQVQMIKEVSSKFKFGKGIKISCQPNPEANKTKNKNILQSGKKSPIIKKFICSKCKIDFSTKPEFREHYKQVHLNEATVADNDVSIKTKNKLQAKCETCDLALSNKKELLKHKKDLHYMNCFKCSAKFEKESQLDEHMNKRHTINCNKCDATFDNNAAYIIHRKEIHFFKCTHCDTCFPEKVKLDKHEIENHNLKCRYCTNKFIDKDLLKAHIVKAHSHRCTQCTSTFEEQSLLVKHEAKVHRSCEVCEDEFSWAEASHECYYTRNKLRPGF